MEGGLCLAGDRGLERNVRGNTRERVASGVEINLEEPSLPFISSPFRHARAQAHEASLNVNSLGLRPSGFRSGVGYLRG